MQGRECVARHKGGHRVPRLAIMGRVEVPALYPWLVPAWGMPSPVSSAGGRCGSATVWPRDIKALRLHPLGLSRCSARSLVSLGHLLWSPYRFFSLHCPLVELFLPRGAEGLCRGIVIVRSRSLAVNMFLSGLSALVSKNEENKKQIKVPRESLIMPDHAFTRSRERKYNSQPLRRGPRQTWTVSAARTTLSAFGIFGYPMCGTLFQAW